MLFEDLWPAMNYAEIHKHECLNNIETIQNRFHQFGSDHNKLLRSLKGIPGIGITIASGLIWSVFPENRVPFDKYTLTYALYEEIFRLPKISTNYTTYSDKIKDYCDKRDYDIEEFVRIAMVKMQEYVEVGGVLATPE